MNQRGIIFSEILISNLLGSSCRIFRKQELKLQGCLQKDTYNILSNVFPWLYKHSLILIPRLFSKCHIWITDTNIAFSLSLWLSGCSLSILFSPSGLLQPAEANTVFPFLREECLRATVNLCSSNSSFIHLFVHPRIITEDVLPTRHWLKQWG